MTIPEAQLIVAQARACFGAKTVNKVFSSDRDSKRVSWGAIDAETTAMFFEDMRGDLSAERQRELHKFIRRNEAQMASVQLNARANNPNFGKPYVRGKAMFESPQKALATGNCTEQSSVAAYLAMSTDPDSAYSTYLVWVEFPADHVFCVVGAPKQPNWSMVADMGSAKAALIVIDPWMNFACRASDYPARSKAKLDKWLAAGKRIYWEGNKGTKPGWYQPAGDYAARFLDSPLVYEYGR